MIDCLFGSILSCLLKQIPLSHSNLLRDIAILTHRHFELCSLLTVQFSKNQVPLRATCDSLSHQFFFVKYFFEKFRKIFFLSVAKPLPEDLGRS